MKIRYIKLILFITILTVVLSSCSSDDPNVKQTATEVLDGEWFVTYKLGGADVGGGYSKILTTNSAANKASEIFITDWVDPNATSGNFWTYKVKATANVSAKTFSADQVASSVEDYNIKITVTNGKVFPKGGFSKTKVVTDSIYFEIEFEDDPGNKYIASGHKRTGFTEDEF